MLYYVVGECQCVSNGSLILRKCGLMKNRDYREVNRYDLRKDKLFEKRPDLYNFTTQILYDIDKGKYVNLNGLQLTQEHRNEIKSMLP